MDIALASLGRKRNEYNLVKFQLLQKTHEIRKSTHGANVVFITKVSVAFSNYCGLNSLEFVH
jgi:hypothetical protein